MGQDVLPDRTGESTIRHQASHLVLQRACHLQPGANRGGAECPFGARYCDRRDSGILKSPALGSVLTEYDEYSGLGWMLTSLEHG
eukprot:CAMPEP_0175946630 /NCGR_PEP_ID=MMETSP0108-20121206/27421_1 /TAXON_ID=195067 ORGANISM="Goniomonas pacifica, Strain CCMP1869" /NCGR_SAMPLE_ID=MMETSP0108 /ASSEMBLY_ACC=CAM_ASM_000204 /LENGTH=84 /DNA_ID=CAMNT_0017272139 /DNA_START=1 /DNA_END=255 /DNA_ORIENTATION=+